MARVATPALQMFVKKHSNSFTSRALKVMIKLSLRLWYHQALQLLSLRTETYGIRTA